jgi:tetratricopeptide (TPR) repeat protein
MTQDPSQTSIDDLDAAVEAGIAHHRAGRLAEAEAAYTEVLREAPGHVAASRNLGLIFLQLRRLDRALPLLAFAAEAEPDNPKGWGAYIQALIVATRFEDAERLLHERQDLGALREPLEIRLYRGWATALAAKGDLDAAEARLRRALDAAPTDPDGWMELGVLQLQRGQAEAATASFGRALQISPDHREALVNMGSAMRTLARNGEAADYYRRALALDPSDPGAVRNLGALLNRLERYDQALACADDALALAPLAEAFLVRGNALAGLDRFEAALESHLEAAKAVALRYDAFERIGLDHIALGRHTEGLAALDAAVALKPDAPSARLRRAMARLLTRDFEVGWQDYESRWRDESFIADSSSVVTPQLRALFDPRLELADLAGRRILLVGEQGIGDVVMFASMIPDLMAVAAEVTCVCDRRLVRLFTASFAGVRVLDPATNQVSFSDFDKVVPIGSLGRMFRNRMADFPGRAYLRPRAEIRDRWADRLGPRPEGMRIGLSWRGGTPKTGLTRRSMTLDQLAPVLELPGCEFVSLQYGDVGAEVAAAGARLGRTIRLFPANEIDDFEELAGLLENLDLVVSVQTTVVHLVGAVGTPCLTMVTHNPEWRYVADGLAMPWHGSVELFRQSRPGTWDEVIRQVAAAVAEPRGRGAG